MSCLHLLLLEKSCFGWLEPGTPPAPRFFQTTSFPGFPTFPSYGSKHCRSGSLPLLPLLAFVSILVYIFDNFPTKHKTGGNSVVEDRTGFVV